MNTSLGALPAKLTNRVLDCGVAPGEAFLPQHLPHPLDRVPLLAGQIPVGLDQLPQPTQPGSDHRLGDGLLP